MDNRDRLEIRKRFNNETTISRMAGCYVDSNKNKVLSLNETFLNLPEDEFYKYLDIAKKTLSGTIGNNILELKFPEAEEIQGGTNKKERYEALEGIEGEIFGENGLQTEIKAETGGASTQVLK